MMKKKKTKQKNIRHRLWNSTLQVATILITMVPKILKLVTWFVKTFPSTKRIGCQNFNLEGWNFSLFFAKILG